MNRISKSLVPLLALALASGCTTPSETVLGVADIQGTVSDPHMKRVAGVDVHVLVFQMDAQGACTKTPLVEEMTKTNSAGEFHSVFTTSAAREGCTHVGVIPSPESGLPEGHLDGPKVAFEPASARTDASRVKLDVMLGGHH